MDDEQRFARLNTQEHTGPHPVNNAVKEAERQRHASFHAAYGPEWAFCAWCGDDIASRYPVTHGGYTASCCSEAHQQALTKALE
jgi:hypothetical protein